MRSFLSLLLTIALACSVAALATPQADKETGTKPPDHGLFLPADVKWGDAPNALPTGAKLAVLEGDPFKEGPFTMRLRMSGGYQIPPHWHAKIEHVTVISGTFNLGMGEKFDQSAGRTMPAGTFAFLAPQTRHFAWATGETVIQLHGVGPWGINYVNPADDPRHKQ